MSNYSSLAQTLPPRVVPLPITAWQTTWDNRPCDTVKVGIRLLSARDYTVSRAYADEQCKKLHPSPFSDISSKAAVEAYNDALMMFAVARGTCDPNNAIMPWLEAAEDNMASALTPDGIRYLWDAMEQVRIESSPLIAPLEDLESLKDILHEVNELPSSQQLSCRKLLARVMQVLSE